MLPIVTYEPQRDPKRQNLKSALCVKGGTHPKLLMRLLTKKYELKIFPAES